MGRKLAFDSSEGFGAMTDETRGLRNSQAQLITLQAARILVLESRVENYAKQVERLEAKVRQLESQQTVSKKLEVQA